MISDSNPELVKKEEILENDIKKLKESSEFNSLNLEIQERIISNMALMASKPNLDIKEGLTIDQKIIYGLLFILVVFLFANVFLEIVHIPVLIYTIFYAVIMAVAFFIIMRKRKDRLDGLYNMIINWDDTTSQNRKDYVATLRNEVDMNIYSTVGKIANGRVIKNLVYLILIAVIAKIGFEDFALSERLYYVLTLSLIFLYIMLTHISILDDLELFGDINDKDFMYLYLEKLLENKKALAIFVFTSEFMMIGYIAYNYYLGKW